MPPIDPHLIVIEEQAELNRRALAESVEEIGRWVRPKNLASLAQHLISSKAWKSLGEFGEAIRSERGKAAVLAAGALAAFYVGRSTQSRTLSQPSPNSFDHTTAYAPKERRFGVNLISERSGVFAQSVKKFAAAAGAIATGYAIGSAAPVSQAERDLMGEASARVKHYATEFRRAHEHGARISVAQTFGVAQLAAGAIGLMGAFAALVGDRGKTHQSSDPVNGL
jgi:uncharacterized protein YcfJ